MTTRQTGADHGPIEAKYRDQMNSIAHALDDALNGEGCRPEDRKIGFFRTLFEFGDKPGGRFNYISNCEKLDVRAMLKDVIARIEGRMIKASYDDAAAKERLDE